MGNGKGTTRTLSAVKVVRRACLAAGSALALLGLGLSFVPAQAEAAAGSGSGPSTPAPSAEFATFSGIADAAGVFATADGQKGSIEPTYQTFYGRLADGLSEYSTNTLYARASLYYPGAAVVGLGTLLCTLGPNSPFCSLPPYPLYTQADSNTPDGSVNTPAPSGGAGAPVGIGAGNADAHVDAVKGVSTNSVLSNYDTPQGSGSVVHVGSIEAHTKQFVDKKGHLVVQALARVSGIDILQGLIHINGVYAASTSTTNGIDKPTKVQDFQVQGVTVNGIPATIGSSGITIAGATSGHPALVALNNDLQAALAKSGFTVRTIGPTKNSLLDPKLCSGGEVDGLQVAGYVPVNVPPNLPTAVEQQLGQLSNVYYMNMVFGGACSDAYAVVAPPTSDNGIILGPPPTVVGGSSSAAASSADTSPTSGAVVSPSDGSAGSSSPALVSGTTAAPGRQQVALPARRTGLRAELLGRDVSHGLKLLYLALTLLFLGLVLGLRPFLPARLPRGG